MDFGIGFTVNGKPYRHNERVAETTDNGMLHFEVPEFEAFGSFAVADVAINIIELHSVRRKCNRPHIPEDIFMKAYATSMTKEYCTPVYRLQCWRVWLGYKVWDCPKETTITMVLFDKDKNF